MEITHDKLQKLLSKSYKIGYATSFRDVILFLNKYPDENINRIIKDLHVYYNSYPCIEPIRIELPK
jgi:hypothetical protein